jgi:hypothetical protein
MVTQYKTGSFLNFPRKELMAAMLPSEIVTNVCSDAGAVAISII